MFEIDIERAFSAAHFLRGYQGNCSALHGHNWSVQAVLRAEKLDSVGIAVDFRSLKKELDEILAGLDHRNLCELPQFASINPTSEMLARFIYRELATRINSPGISVSRVRVCESPGDLL